MVLFWGMPRRGGVKLVQRQEEFAYLLDDLLRKRRKVCMKDALKEMGKEYNPNNARILNEVAWAFCARGFVRLEDRRRRIEGKKYMVKYRYIIGYSRKAIEWFDRVYFAYAHQRREIMSKARKYMLVPNPEKTAYVAAYFPEKPHERYEVTPLRSKLFVLMRRGIKTNFVIKKNITSATNEEIQKEIEWMVERGFWTRRCLWKQEYVDKITEGETGKKEKRELADKRIIEEDGEEEEEK